jgi:RNA polymerase sigma-70 factor (ECF subfamily)
MSKHEPDPMDTPALHQRLDRWQAGDRDAADELLQMAGARLEKLARRMCKSFPNVRSWAEAGDVFQGSMMRLLRSLRSMRPASTREFFSLAAVHIRRELLDLARHYRRKGWIPLYSHAPHGNSTSDSSEPQAASADDLDLWARFHEAVDELPSEEREVVGLVFYHGWTQAKIAELFQVDERTIRRRWAAACRKLREMVGTALPNE